MNRTIKIVCIIVIVLAYLIVFSQNVYAAKSKGTSISDIFTKADDFLHAGQGGSANAGATIDDDAIKAMSDVLYNTLFIIGIAAAVIIGLILGIKYMTGSITEQVKIKESIMAYIVGCVVVFGAFGIWKLVVTVLQTVQ